MEGTSIGGITAAQARIEEIRARFAVTSAPLATATAAGRSGTVGGSSFATSLDTAMAATTGSDVATRRAPGTYPALKPPAELQAFGNGRLPAHALSPVGATGHSLYAPAARSLERLMSDASAAGVKIRVTDSYRPLADQERLARTKGLYKNGGLAAVPGTSNHGWGMAVDLDLDDAAQRWMRENGHRYGFVEDTPREPWHWGYRPDRLS